MSNKLTGKFTNMQVAFMKSYVVCKNATRAAVEAGYSPKTAASQGQRLLKNVEIRSMVDRALAKIAEGQEVRAAEVIRETKYVAMSNMANYISLDADGEPYVDISKIDHKLGVAVKSLEVVEVGVGAQRKRRVKITLHDKLKALDKLDAATNAFTSHNKAIENAPKVVIQVVTNIPGAPGSNVKRAEPTLGESA